MDVLEDPTIRGLAAKIEAHEDNERFGDDHHGYVSEITLEFGDSSVRLLADGFPRIPGAAARLRRDYREVYAIRDAGDRSCADRGTIVDRVADLEHLDDVADLAALLRTPQVRSGRVKRACGKGG